MPKLNPSGSNEAEQSPGKSPVLNPAGFGMGVFSHHSLLRRTGLIGFAEVGHALLFNEEALARQEFNEALYDSVECSSPAVGTRTSWNIGTPSVAR